MQGTGEQEKGQEPLHQGFGKIDATDKTSDGLAQAKAGQQHIDRQDDQRDRHGDNHQTDRLGQLQKSVVEVPKDRGKHDHHRGKIEDGIHGLCPKKQPGRTPCGARPG